jgi:Uma2 family endonuclease
MSTIIDTRAAPTSDGDQCVELRDVGWNGYLALLKLRGERSVPRLVYLDGSVQLVCPSEDHEWLADRLSMLVREVITAFGMPCRPTRNMTFRKRSERGGVEGDASFYLASFERIRGKKIDLRVDPPPDLAIEAVHANPATKSLAVYRRLGVPEVWVGDMSGVKILVLAANGRYARSQTSLAFPFLSAAEVSEWVLRPDFDDETQWLVEVRRWVTETLVPRGGPAKAHRREAPDA